MIFDFPSVMITDGKAIFNAGKYLNLPVEYFKDCNSKILTSFYNKLFIDNHSNELVSGEDPLGFYFFKYDFICYVGLVVDCEKRSKLNNLRKKHPQNKFTKSYISKRIEEEHKLINFKEYIPIEVITQNLHELRGLNAKISSNIDTILKVEDENQWESKFDDAEHHIKKIYVASRLIKFILDNTKFYNPDFWDNLDLKKDRYFIAHRSVSKIVKIYRNDFKREKPDLEFSGNSHRKLQGDKEYFEILIKILVENAYKYSDYKKIGPQVKIKEANHKIIIEVRSYGKIIPEEEREFLFTKGFRSTINKIKRDGTGMGLYNAKMLTQKFNGKIKYCIQTIKKEEGFELGWNIFTITFNNTFDSTKNAFS